MGDVSSRKYFRACNEDGRSWIVAWYPPEAAPSYQRYRRATELLAGVGVRTPEILGIDPDHRYMALEDLGDRRLFDLGSAPESRALLEQATEIAERITTLPVTEVEQLNPPLDRALLRRELQQTWQLFLSARVAGEDARLLLEGFDGLCDALTREPLAPCHRDFMSRNLMVVGESPRETIVVIDHQDLRLGPQGYDLASLFHDSCPLEPSEIARIEAEWSSLCGSAAYHRLVVQRTLKIVGTFHAFAARGVPRYLPMVPRALTAACDHLAALPPFGPLAASLRRDLLECAE